MKIAIMQPYFMPYIGYFQLIRAVDTFIIYDNIQYTKKGWINRNKYLFEDKAKLFTIPIKKDSDFLNIDQRELSQEFENSKEKLLRLIKYSYKESPNFNIVYPLFESILNYNEKNLFKFIYNSILEVCHYLSIETDIIISSTLPIDHSLKSNNKVLAICNYMKATAYYNSIGGLELYNKEQFLNDGVKLSFIKTKQIKYAQFNNTFVPMLSMLDVMMFNSIEEIQLMLDNYELI
jgi:hypothetical protein